MGKHKLLKRAAAAMLAASLILGGLPKGSGGLLTKAPALKASAGEFDSGNPLQFWQSSKLDQDETIYADVDTEEGSVITIGSTTACNITIKGTLNLAQNTELHLYNGSFLILSGNLYLSKGCKIICDGNSKIVFNSDDGALYVPSDTEDYGYQRSDLIFNPAENLWNSIDFSSNQTFDGNVTVVDCANIRIKNNSIVTVNGDLDFRVASNLQIDDGSYLFVKGSLRFGANTNITCDGTAKILLYTTTDKVNVIKSTSTKVDEEDLVGTNLSTLTYIPDYISSKNYFSSNGTDYTFDGSKFTAVKDNATTLALKELCTYTSQEAVFDRQILFSEAARDAFDYACTSSNNNLTKELVGYMIDGDTCSKLHSSARAYRHTPNSNAFRNAFRIAAGYGTSYVVTAEEAEELPLPGPVFTSEQMLVGFELTMFLKFDDIDETTLNDYSVILTGSCAEAGKEQKITYNTDINSYCVSATVPVNHQSDTITGQLYYKGQKSGLPFTTSVEKYLEALSNQETIAKDIAHALLVYGRAAANYFNDEEDKEFYIRSEINSYRDQYNLKDADDVAKNFPERLIPKYQPSDAKVAMVLGNTVTLRCYLDIMKDYEVGKEFSSTGYIVEEDKYGRYISIPGLLPFDMVNRVVLFKYDDVQLNCSCCAWVYRVLTADEFQYDHMLQDLAVAIYAYAQAGYDLFNSISNNS